MAMPTCPVASLELVERGLEGDEQLRSTVASAPSQGVGVVRDQPSWSADDPLWEHASDLT
jgi:hypothetical protein